ncbi:MAG: DUF3426 domain-containing protein [Alphaproteobacteria bacterium]
MQITCSSCNTKFVVADRLIGPNGRKLRCASCGAVWHQYPPKAEPEYEPEPVPEEDFEDAPPSRPQFRNEPAFEDEEEKPAPPPSPARASERDPLPFEMDPPGSGARAEGDPEDAAEALVRNVLDHEFPQDAPEEPSVRRAVDAVRNRLDSSLDSDLDRGRDLGSDDEEDPLPGVFSSSLSGEEEERKRPWIKILVGAVVVLILGPLVGAVLMRDTIVAKWPGAIPVYKALRITVRTLGAGLEFRMPTPERALQGKTEVLVVRGGINNVTSELRPVPKLRLSLQDAEGKLVQETVSRPPKEVLGPGETMTYRIVLENPSAEAQQINVTFTEGDAPPSP